MKFGGEVTWRPTAEVVERCRLKRFMNELHIETLGQLLEQSLAEPEWFWPTVIEDLGIRFRHPFHQALDLSAGPPWAKWWSGGRMNIVDSCLGQQLEAGEGSRTAVIWEGEAGESRRLTYSELNQEVGRLAGGLKSLGVGVGDRIGIFLPMVPETVIALLAGARLGAVLIPLFSGFGATAVAMRLQDQKATVLLTADGFYRRGKLIAMKEVADQAASLCPSLRHMVVLNRIGREVPWQPGRDWSWTELLSQGTSETANLELDPESPLMVIYTSGTTGQPKGTRHVHGGFPIKAAQDLAHGFDMGRDDLLFWFTDLGWMMG
ncbi:MAG: AMP-binding protein, partial [Candidatus Dormibacteraceae bacterium]